MTTLRRFLVVQAFAAWQGGFLFYSAVVVPAGTDLFGASAQGEVTRTVTDRLNLIGLAWAAVFLWELLADGDPARGRRRLRWAGWGLEVGLLAVLAVLHLKLDALLDGETRRGFYPWHAAYLWASAAQWAVGLLLAWLTVRAWGTPRGSQPDARARVGAA